MSPTNFLRGFAKRVENMCRSDHTALAVVRSVWYKYQAYVGKSVKKFMRRTNKNLEMLPVQEYITAMQKLAKTLDHGVVGKGVLKMPVAGDPSKLPYAEGLSVFERNLAHEINFSSEYMPGNAMVRRLMGHSATGARVVYGESLFFTWSPNEQNSALVLRIMRNRKNDTMLLGQEETDAWLRRCSRVDEPKISKEEQKKHDAQTDTVTVTLPLPRQKDRQRLCARDARAVVARYMYEVKFKLPWLLGLRVCPWCPYCNRPGSSRPCQDIFGSNMQPMGGALGGASTLGGATEYQKHTTPHLHAQVHLVNVYQYMTLVEIAALIEEKWLDPQTVIDFTEWIHAERPPNAEQMLRDKERVSAAWFDKFNNGEHEDLCVSPISVTTAAATSEAEAGSWKEQYDMDAQFFFSRVQEHVHRLDSKKGLQPLRACLSKRCMHKCKHGFPKKVQPRWCVVCLGNYKKLKVRISGRRNALGSVVGRRSSEYQSGTMRAFAVCMGSNSHTAPNYRLPPVAASHDPDCTSEQCKEVLDVTDERKRRLALLRIAKTMQRASREMAGYFYGYTFKGQPVGKKALAILDKSMQYLQKTLEELPAEKRFKRTVNRAMVDFHHSTTTRPSTEEAMLSMYVNDDDVSSAEFIRLYDSRDFYGNVLLSRLEMQASGKPIQKEYRIPCMTSDLEDRRIMLKSFDLLYGCRPKNPEIFYLNAWEFLMWWEVLPKRHVRYREGFVMRLDYPKDIGLDADFQDKYGLVRRVRPVVPAPKNTPMPDRIPLFADDKRKQRDQRSRLYSVYMRPSMNVKKFGFL